MKKYPIYLLAAFLWAFFSQAAAQNHYGLKASAGFANQKTKPAQTSTNTISRSYVNDGLSLAPAYQIGGYHQLALGKRFFLQSEVFFSGKGYRTGATGGKIVIRRQLFAGGGLLAGIRIDKKLSFMAGANAGFILDGKKKTPIYSYHTDYTADLRLQYALKPRLNLEFGYSWGLSAFEKNTQPFTPFLDRTKTRFTYFSVMYSLKKNKANP